jgi:hypothetical protein
VIVSVRLALVSSCTGLCACAGLGARARLGVGESASTLSRRGSTSVFCR